MIVYSKNELKNLFFVNEVKSLEKAGFVTSEQTQQIAGDFPHLVRQDKWILRIILFILGLFLISSIIGVIVLLTNVGNTYFFDSLSVIYTLIGIIGLEIIIKKFSSFGNGLDDAFLYCFLISAGSTSYVFLQDLYLTFLIFSIVSLLSYFRYLHLVSLVFGYFGLVALVCTLCFEYLSYGKEVLPFALLLLAFVFFLFSLQVLKKEPLPYYKKGIQFVKYFSLILLYFSCNYLLVRELSIILISNQITEISFYGFFWMFTITVPVLYILYSLKTKDRGLFWIGILLAGFSVFTFRFYYSIIPTEVALIIGGLILFGMVYWSIQKIKRNEKGITFKVDRFVSLQSQSNAEAIIINSYANSNVNLAENNTENFGNGGEFGGGGANSSF